MRSKLTGSGTVLVAMFVLILGGATAWGTALRHDRSDALAVKLGEKYAAVGRVLPDGGCTLIAPTWVITAAHVAASLSKQAGRVRFGDREYRVSRVVLHPQAKIEPGRPPEVDLALVELTEPVDGVTPVSIYKGGDELGKQVVIVGFGDVGDGKHAFRKSDGLRRAVTNIVTDAGPRCLFVHFDEPPKGTELEGVGAPGDSGGPAFLEVDGTVYLAGVSSASAGGRPGRYGVDDIYTRVSRYTEWIDNSMKKIVPKNP